MDTLSYKTVSANDATVNKEWLVVDATDEIVGRLASKVAKLLRGKHKANFTPHVDCGDNVIIVNAEKIKFTGNKLVDKEYIRHSGYPGGQKSKTAEELMKKFPDVLWFVDAVSSIGGIKIEVDKLGIDMCLASAQKAIALPPGIAVSSVSDNCYNKASTVKGRGYYFDLLELKNAYIKDQTPYTPSIPHLYALKKQLDRMGNITRKLQSITKYETKDYAAGEKIIDIDRAIE